MLKKFLFIKFYLLKILLFIIIDWILLIYLDFLLDGTPTATLEIFE